jgi:hypothetical protein
MQSISARYQTLLDLFDPDAARSARVNRRFREEYLGRCGVDPPEALSAYVDLAGHLESINRALNRMLDASEYYKFGDLLVFYEEAQRVVVWGFDPVLGASGPDPAVFQTSPPQSRWAQEYATLSDFLVSMFFWQAVNGGLPFGGNLFLDAPTSVRLDHTWAPDDLVEHGYRGGLTVYYRPRQLVCVSRSGSDWMLHGAASTQGAFAELTGSLGVDWLGTWS